MKKFGIGMLAGYLLTSIFSIPALPTYFWFFSGGLAIVITMVVVAWWRFNEGTGTSYADSSTNSFTGSGVNTPTWSTNVPT